MSFTFKQFHIDDDQCAMKVGTDSILLGSMAEVAPNNRVLDIGCGCGLLSLMMAQRMGGSGQVAGIEIDEVAAVQAGQNIANSPWSNVIEIVQADINQYESKQPFDLVIANPPYFNDSLLGPDHSRNTARHTQSLTQLQLLTCAERLMTEKGRFWLVLPVEPAKQLIKQSGQGSLFLNQLCRVHTVKDKPVHRYIMSFAKYDVAQVAQSDIDVYDENNQYSRQFIALTRNFYLNR